MIERVTPDQRVGTLTWDDHGVLPVQEIPWLDEDAQDPDEIALVDEGPVGTSTRSLAWREAALAIGMTLSVTVLPAVIVALVLPGANAFLAAGCAVAISLALANLESRAWRAWPGSRDLPYKDLTVWGLAHRRWSERRLRSARRMYEAAAREGSAIQIEPLEDLSRLLAASNPYTFNHVRRVAAHAEEVARALHLPPAEVARIRTAAVVHDIGKLHTPPWILDKPGALTGAELAVIKRHPVEGARMLEGVGDPELAAIVRHHHERFDGGGYPDGLSGQQIPLGSRIITVADSFDAITSTRPYRRARSQRAALQVLVEESDMQFDPEVVQAFLERYSPRRSLAPMAVVAAICQRGWEALPLTLAGGAGAGAALPALGAASVAAMGPAIHHGTQQQVLAAQGQPLVVMERTPVHRHKPGIIKGAHSPSGGTIFVGNKQDGNGGRHGAGHDGGRGRGLSGGHHGAGAGRGSSGGRGGSGGSHRTGTGGGHRLNAITSPKTGVGHAVPVSNPQTGGAGHHRHHSGSGSNTDKDSHSRTGSTGKGTSTPQTDSPTTTSTPTTTTGTPTTTSPTTTTPTTTPAPTTTSTPGGTTTTIPPVTVTPTPTPTTHETTAQESEEITKKLEAEAREAKKRLEEAERAEKLKKQQEATEAINRAAEETKKRLQEALERTAGDLQGSPSAGAGENGDEP